MKQTVKETAKEFAKSVIDSFGRSGVPGSISDIKEFIALGFENGSEWRINSVWHKTKDEVPQAHGEYKNEHYPQIPCLVYGKISTGTGYGVRYWNVTEQCWDDEECDDYECSKDAIEEWAYLDDLIPNKKQ